MPTTPSDPVSSPGQDAPKDPVDLLVKALAAVPEADRDLVYAWLLRRGSEPGQVTGLAPSRMARRVPVATLLRQNVTLDPGVEARVAIVSGAQLPQASEQQMVPVRFSSEQHAKSYAGVLLACWSAGSMLAGLITGTLAWRRPPIPRVRVGTALLALVMVPMSFVGSMLAMGVALFVAGFAIAPTLIALFAAIEHGVPAARLTEGIAITHTGLAAGLAPGAALAGLVIDAHGASPSYLVALGSGVLAALAALALPRSFDPLDRQPSDGPGGAGELSVF